MHAIGIVLTNRAAGIERVDWASIDIGMIVPVYPWLGDAREDVVVVDIFVVEDAGGVLVVRDVVLA